MYKAVRLQERTEGIAGSLKGRSLHPQMHGSVSLTSMHSRRISAITDTRLPSLTGGGHPESLQGVVRPPTSQSIATARTLISEPIEEEEEARGGVIPQVPESYDQRLRRIREALARKKMQSQGGKILKELKLNLNSQ